MNQHLYEGLFLLLLIEAIFAIWLVFYECTNQSQRYRMFHNCFPDLSPSFTGPRGFVAEALKWIVRWMSRKLAENSPCRSCWRNCVPISSKFRVFIWHREKYFTHPGLNALQPRNLCGFCSPYRIMLLYSPSRFIDLSEAFLTKWGLARFRLTLHCLKFPIDTSGSEYSTYLQTHTDSRRYKPKLIRL